MEIFSSINNKGGIKTKNATFYTMHDMYHEWNIILIRIVKLVTYI